jgi:hypothetical protein
MPGFYRITCAPPKPIHRSKKHGLVVDIPKVMRIASDRDLLLSGQAPTVAASSEQPMQRPLDTPAPTHHPDDAPTRR